LHLPPQVLMSNQAMRWEPEALALSALVKQQAATAIQRLPEANPLRQAMNFEQENRHFLAADLDLLQREQGWRVARPLVVVRVNPQEPRLPRAVHSPALLARVRRHSQDQDPSAFFREIPVGRKYNRAARCGGLPIFARYRRLRNQRGLAGCDSRCSRSPRKRAGLARPFPIVAGDKRRCRPLPFAD
jgi:hypothetical protein